MKKYTITACILMAIAVVCAALIASVNLWTAPMIEKNNTEKKAKLCQEIFSTYEESKSKTSTSGFKSEYIVEKIEAYDSASAPLGYIYTVQGSNTYGEIELLVGIHSDLSLAGVRFITNGQSFSKETATHLDRQYKENMTMDDVSALDLSDSDVTAGATYASKLIRSLVLSALEDCKGGVA